MLEDNLRALFTLEAEVAQPPARISVPAASRATRPRRRLAVAIGAPVLAAAAVVAVVTGPALLAPGAGPGPGPGALVPETAPARIPPTDFSLLLVYASFGWLPAATKVTDGGTGVEWQFVNAAGPKASLWSLSAFAPGECRMQRVTGAGSSQPALACADHAPLTLTGRAPLVEGRQAYWVGGFLAWRYSATGWAMLEYPFSCSQSASTPCRPGPSATAVRVAQHASVGAPVAGIRFPASLAGVPRTWRLDSVAFSREAGVDVATRYEITNGALVLPPGAAGTPDNTITVTINPASSSSACSFVSGTPAPEVINGYHVLVDQIGAPALWQQFLCAASARGLRVYIVLTSRRPMADAPASIFAHLHLLGTDPARWATRPIG